MPETEQTDLWRRIAWDRVSFEVPRDWELASYRWPKPGQTIIELEDDFSTCLQGRWQWTDDDEILHAFLKAQEERDGDLAKRADHKTTLKGLAKGWSGIIYHFSQTVPDKEKTKIQVEKTSICHLTILDDGYS